MERYDLCVLGAGPGGLSAAIRAARKGAHVCLVDPGPLGGTCLNQGCIPARALGATAKLMAQVRQAETLGIVLSGPAHLDLGRVNARKDRILNRLRAGLKQLVSRSRVTWTQGEGILQGPKEVEIRFPGKPSQGVQAKAVVLATGSRPGALPGCPVDGELVVTSDEILELTRLPSSLIVIGAGVVGSEFASYFCDLGIPVTLLEAQPQVLPFQEERIAEAFAQSLKRRGVTIMTGAKVKGIVRVPGRAEAKVSLTDGRDRTASMVLLAAGRIPQLPKGAEGIGLKVKDKGLTVDERLRTKVPSIFAIGDLLGEHQLACTASYEGALAAENALGGNAKPQYAVVPDAIFTEPEIATVGLTEAQALEKGHPVTVSRLSLTGFARAQTFEETEGFVQVVAGKKTGRLLGVQMIGPRATDLIGEAALGLKHGLTLHDLVDTLHGHPTMSESLWETAAMALGQSIYYATGD